MAPKAKKVLTPGTGVHRRDKAAKALNKKKERKERERTKKVGRPSLSKKKNSGLLHPAEKATPLKICRRLSGL